MTLHAAWPTWMTFIIVMMFVGPAMRFVFGGGRYRRLDRWRNRLPRQESEQLANLETALSERDTVIDDLQQRLSELESRLDFAERLLSERGTTLHQTQPAIR
jgi:chromosome segregation ATPase